MANKLLLSLTLASLLASHTLLAEENMDADLGGFDTETSSSESFNELDGFGDEEEVGDDLDGFGDDTSTDKIAVEVQESPSNLSVTGNVAFKTAFGYFNHSVYADKASPTPSFPQGELLDPVDYQGFNQAQTSIYLQADYKINSDWKVRVSGDAFYDAIYDLRDEPYNQDTLDTYKTQLRFDDTYIQGRLTKDIDIKIGRQLVVWGKSDSIRITDVINPLDNRLPGMTDIEDLRLATTMAKLDYYVGQWNFSAMAIVESRIFLEAAPRGEYFPVDNIFPIAPSPFFELVQPNVSWDNMQYAIAANGVFSGWDLSFYGADVFDSKWHIVPGDTPQNTKRVVGKIQMLGSAVNIATGSWLLKSEIAFINGVKYNSTDDAKQRLDALIGVDYMGVKDTVLSIELANRHIFDYEVQMGEAVAKPDYIQENEVQTAMRVTRSFENDSINATLLLSMFGEKWQYGGFFRASVEYDLMDAVVANFGIIDYLDTSEPEIRPFTRAIKDNDKIFADITYSF